VEYTFAFIVQMVEKLLYVLRNKIPLKEELCSLILLLVMSVHLLWTLILFYRS